MTEDAGAGLPTRIDYLVTLLREHLREFHRLLGPPFAPWYGNRGAECLEMGHISTDLVGVEFGDAGFCIRRRGICIWFYVDKPTVGMYELPNQSDLARAAIDLAHHAERSSRAARFLYLFDDAKDGFSSEDIKRALTELEDCDLEIQLDTIERHLSAQGLL